MQDDIGTLLRSFLNNALRKQPQRRIRDFGGYEVGKRRNLHVIKPIARDTADFLCTYLLIRLRGEPASREGVASTVAAALKNVSDEFAYKLTWHSDEAWNSVCNSVAEFLEGCLQIEAKPYDGSLTAQSDYNGWKSWEMVVSGETPRGRWRHSWKEKPGDDFIGFYGDACMGRIFKIDLTGSDERWYWLIAADGSPRRGWPAAGFEANARSAACRVERIYFALVAGTGRVGSG
ncbi:MULTISPECIES: hypothetical protein [Rhizobium]|uniref:hypothetical protein n=1 Tax=Rhizobium TaxID=379 RepID=UPI000BE7F0BE|nr:MULTISPECIES: hypothetical protein [Rhizobium]MBY4589131.1 hypothetical protein [Rhizobium redzepovicii]MBY4616680.1 hypothetical protein [Rhizobium redzepovicii]MDF0659743.1 hypothetical protein [Rhizobium sp. BC49]PDS85242.1 hypothetical protein CO654_12250 [Rhizobium sp. L18]TBY44198.1 hypothetical protein E0H54_27020 [Rhizobium leguminosarum bv. viciae]